MRLDIDEEGTKAAAVTAIATGEGAAPDEPEYVEVIVDRPYILLLQDRELGATLFAVVVTDPR